MCVCSEGWREKLLMGNGIWIRVSRGGGGGLSFNTNILYIYMGNVLY